jgi:hypothetical protein
VGNEVEERGRVCVGDGCWVLFLTDSDVQPAQFLPPIEVWAMGGVREGESAWVITWRKGGECVWVMDCIVLCCIVLYCIVLCCIVLCCVVLYCVVLYCIVLYCIVTDPDVQPDWGRSVPACH